VIFEKEMGEMGINDEETRGMAKRRGGEDGIPNGFDRM
jgi:hypothetical protein